MFQSIEQDALGAIQYVLRQLWGQRQVGSNFVDMTLCIDSIYDASELYDLTDKVREIDGVIAVSSEPSQPRLISLQYNPEQTGYAAIVAQARDKLQLELRMIDR